MHSTLMVKRSSAVLVTAVLWLMAATQAFAVDTLTPPTVNETLPAGGSIMVDKILHLDGLPAKADIIVAIDTTFSMNAALEQAKLDAIDICNDVQDAIPGARFAAVEFQDYPISPYGAAGDSPYELHTTFTADCTTFSAAVGLMALGDGGDGPEANNRVHFEAYSDPALTSVRDAQATQFLVVLADNVPHSMTTYGACPSTAPLSDPGRNGINESGAGDDLDTAETILGLTANGITLLYIDYGAFALSCHEAMAAGTGGDAVPSSAAPDIAAFIIANAELVPYTVNLEVSAGCQIGFDFGGAFPTSSHTGEQTIPFVETITAPTVPDTYTCMITAVMTPGGATTAVETVTVTVVPADPATLVLTPPTATNVVDEEHCVTATVRDEFGNLTPGITVRFSVSGSVSSTGSVTTNASGQAEFCYTGPGLPGADVITAYADTNADNVNDATEPEDTTTKTWVIPANQEECKVTYGGRITAANGDKATFGGNATGVGPVGEEEYQDHGPAVDINVHSIEILAVTCSADGTMASIFGSATINGEGSYDFRIDLKDLGEPGSSDTYRIRLSSGYDSGEQVLDRGNVQIH